MPGRKCLIAANWQSQKDSLLCHGRKKKDPEMEIIGMSHHLNANLSVVAIQEKTRVNQNRPVSHLLVMISKNTATVHISITKHTF